MQDRPTAQELVEVVRGFLEAEIIPTMSDPRLKYRGLIAANVLSIVARELADGEKGLLDERSRLADLLDEDARDPFVGTGDLRSEVGSLNRLLASLIRSGSYDEANKFDAAHSALEAGLIAKLRISNPRYLERVLGQ